MWQTVSCGWFRVCLSRYGGTDAFCFGQGLIFFVLWMSILPRASDIWFIFITRFISSVFDLCIREMKRVNSLQRWVWRLARQLTAPITITRHCLISLLWLSVCLLLINCVWSDCSLHLHAVLRSAHRLILTWYVLSLTLYHAFSISRDQTSFI